MAHSITFADWKLCAKQEHTSSPPVEQTIVAGKKNTEESHFTTVQVMMPSPDVNEHDISVRTRPAQSNVGWRERSPQRKKCAQHTDRRDVLKN